jgi:hypothetical protein
MSVDAPQPPATLRNESNTMKSTVLVLAFVLSSSTLSFAQSRFVTLTINGVAHDGPLISKQTLSIQTNESAVLVTLRYAGVGVIGIVKDGITNSSQGLQQSGTECRIAGPAEIIFENPGSAQNLLTVRIDPESFPPGQTIILPEGTVGTVHVESSTNLIHWQDEWSQTFADTNANRFLRLRAERSLP